jgi:hypothetical protein
MQARSEDMTSRRQFIEQSGAAGLLLAGVCLQAKGISAARSSGKGLEQVKQYAQIKALIRRDETIARCDFWGSGFAMTMAGDGRQFVVCGDGWGTDKYAKTMGFHSRMFTVSGDPPNLRFQDVGGYPDMWISIKDSGAAPFWGGGCVVVDGIIYQSFATSNEPVYHPDGSLPDNLYMVGSKLIYSRDLGRTWCNQGGTSPVIWEKWGSRSRQNMTFFKEEPEGAFAWLNFLQMGRNYELNKDGYLYVYSNNGDSDGTINELVMFRAPRDRIMDRKSYEFFSGLKPDGTALWTGDISARVAVHTFPRGWVNRNIDGEASVAWLPSVTFNPMLGVYMMATWGTGCAANGGWYGKPSYLGIWVSRYPWGPFSQIHEESAWTPGGDGAARAFAPQIPAGWISADGKSFWLVWSDYQFKGPSGETENPDKVGMQDLKQYVADEAEFGPRGNEYVMKYMRHFCLNMQRVDLVVA